MESFALMVCGVVRGFGVLDSGLPWPGETWMGKVRDGEQWIGLVGSGTSYGLVSYVELWRCPAWSSLV